VHNLCSFLSWCVEDRNQSSTSFHSALQISCQCARSLLALPLTPSSWTKKFVTTVPPLEPAPTGCLKDDVDTSPSKERSTKVCGNIGWGPCWRVRWGEIPFFLPAMLMKSAIVRETLPGTGTDILLWSDRKPRWKEVLNSDHLHWRDTKFAPNWQVVHSAQKNTYDFHEFNM
jgi:hypothetical protein